MNLWLYGYNVPSLAVWGTNGIMNENNGKPCAIQD